MNVEPRCEQSCNSIYPAPLLARLVSLADHMAAASAPRPVSQPVHVRTTVAATGGPALTEDELMMASGAYNADKYNEYQRQVQRCGRATLVMPSPHMLTLVVMSCPHALTFLRCRFVCPLSGGHGDGAQGAGGGRVRQ